MRLALRAGALMAALSALAALPGVATAAAPVACAKPAIAATPGKSGKPFCTSLAADPDGDGRGREKGKACRMRTAADIVADMGHGWNLGNTLDAVGNTASPLSDETHWGNPRTSRANIDAIHRAGFGTLRLPVSWDDHVSGPEWSIDPAWMSRVEEVAQYALANGMYVIVNIHHNNGWEAPTPANEAAAKEGLVKLWRQIAARFRRHDHHLIFETMNEPRVAVNGVDDWVGKPENYEVVNRLNAAALATIRAGGGNNGRRLVMLPGYAAGTAPAQLAAIVLPTDPMIALSTHAYAPYDFALNTTGTAKFTGQAELDALFARLQRLFVARGTPVIMGEWASTDKNNPDDRARHARHYVQGARKAGIPAIWWDNGAWRYPGRGEIMGIFDRRTNSFARPEILQAIVCEAQ
jgi:endoglucanase